MVAQQVARGVDKIVEIELGAGALVLSQFSAHDGMTDNFGHSYPASAANC